jgi:hypothetical protein
LTIDLCETRAGRFTETWVSVKNKKEVKCKISKNKKKVKKNVVGEIKYKK